MAMVLVAIWRPRNARSYRVKIFQNGRDSGGAHANNARSPARTRGAHTDSTESNTADRSASICRPSCRHWLNPAGASHPCHRTSCLACCPRPRCAQTHPVRPNGDQIRAVKALESSPTAGSKGGSGSSVTGRSA